MIAELERLKTEPISDRELQRSKNQFARDYILGRESMQEKAPHLAHAEVLHSDITTADGEFDIFQNISLADVQRVAKTYFTPERRIVLHVMPQGRCAMMALGVRICLAYGVLGLATVAARAPASVRRPTHMARLARRLASQARQWPTERPPRPLEARPVKFPPYEIRKLPNGLQVVIVSQHEQPSVSVRMIVRAGAAQDPKGKMGVAMLDGHAARSGRGQTHRRADRGRDRFRRRHSLRPAPAPISPTSAPSS